MVAQLLNGCAEIASSNKRVQEFLVQHKKYGGFRQYSFDVSFDVSFDGNNYLLTNGRVVMAGQQKWLSNSDPSKYGEDDLSNLEFYVYLKVPPKQIGE